MKLRIAKKIMLFNPNAHTNKHFYDHLRALRPPRKECINGITKTIYPSLHDIDIIRRARTRLLKWFRKAK